MRAVIHLPIIHGIDDLGSVGQELERARSPDEAREARATVDHFWSVLETAIDGWGLDFAKVRIYQDGLPVCGRESAIVAETASAGSRNFRLLQTLETRGAVIMGTESPDLLMEEYSLMRRIHDSGPDNPPPDPASAKAILNGRDEYIAKRIDTTLREGEIGLLFLGLLHDIESRLPEDIKLIQPLGKPKVG